MKFDISQGGPRHQSLVIVGASWGAKPSQQLAQWFYDRYKVPVRLHIIIDGANLVGFPSHTIGPAEVQKAYHIEGWHWPRGGRVRGAENVTLGDIDHNSGLFIGTGHAVDDILQLLVRKA